ncbi:hypothetical protein [Okeania sp.]|uniref:hypothetical protein n=1 Tax=Okeania sp. TaxID=3100323 RepID=UPI002B4B91A7|nr:hypothetical protein [Okeania sp.]MEB3340591.1 hypothetical protein [Okeania sp.]
MGKDEHEIQVQHFSLLKSKYQATKYQNSSPLSFLYLILRRVDLGISITDIEFQYLEANQLFETIKLINLELNLKQYKKTELKRLGYDFLELKTRYKVPKNFGFYFLHPLLLKLDSENILTDSEIKLLKDYNLKETLAIANQIQEFAKLKIKYRATNISRFFPDKLFRILKKIDSAETLNKQESNWLSNNGFLETLEIYSERKKQKQREDEAKFAELKDKYQATKYWDKSISSKLFSILKKLETETILEKSELDWLQKNKLTETFSIADKQKHKIEFTRLKKKYKVTEFEDSSPDSNLYEILQKVEQFSQLIEVDIDWLKSHGLNKIVKIAKDKDWKRLRDKYLATDQKLKFDPFYNILSRLDKGERLDKLMFTQLTTENLLYLGSKIAITYYQIEADFFEEEFKRTKNKWLIPKISSYWRKAKKPLKALEITGKVNLEKLKDKDLKARILVTRGAAFRDVSQLNEGKHLALQAHKIDSKSHHPCTLMGAICYGLGEYGDGDYWFEEARKRGAKTEDIDKEIKRLVQETSKKNKRREIIEYLLKKDERRYAWAKKYLKN